MRDVTDFSVYLSYSCDIGSKKFPETLYAKSITPSEVNVLYFCRLGTAWDPVEAVKICHNVWCRNFNVASRSVARNFFGEGSAILFLCSCVHLCACIYTHAKSKNVGGFQPPPPLATPLRVTVHAMGACTVTLTGCYRQRPSDVVGWITCGVSATAASAASLGNVRARYRGLL